MGGFFVVRRIRCDSVLLSPQKNSGLPGPPGYNFPTLCQISVLYYYMFTIGVCQSDLFSSIRRGNIEKDNRLRSSYDVAEKEGFLFQRSFAISISHNKSRALLYSMSVLMPMLNPLSKFILFKYCMPS